MSPTDLTAAHDPNPARPPLAGVRILEVAILGPGAITTDPSRHGVPGNFFYLNPRNFTLSARLDF